MYRKDYLQRKIDELGKALAKILAELKTLKEQQQADEVIEATLIELLEQVNIDLEAALTTPNEELLKSLVRDKEYSNEQLKYLADIIYEYATYTNDDANRREGLQKALTLYEHIVATETETLHFEMLQRIKGIKGEIS